MRDSYRRMIATFTVPHLEMEAGHKWQFLHGQLFCGLLVTQTFAASYFGRTAEMLRPRKPLEAGCQRRGFFQFGREALRTSSFQGIILMEIKMVMTVMQFIKIAIISLFECYTACK